VSVSPDTVHGASHFKDDGLERLAEVANVAQFASFTPGDQPTLRHARIFGDPAADELALDDAVRLLLDRSVEQSVNVRSYQPDQPKSNDFIYGLGNVDDAVAAIRRLAAAGLYTIVNETIDINDGGVSGVSSNGLIEFAPGDTPRCVEKPGTAVFPREVGSALLETVYGFRPAIPESSDLRIEFSVHPIKRGYRHTHTIIWEEEEIEPLDLAATINWPNHFSRFLGDKTFGLLVADAFGFTVPRTTVVGRHVAPFPFGQSTDSGEYWIRTAPLEPVPGKFTTQRGWRDPFRLLEEEDPGSEVVVSVLSQEGVAAVYSGAAAETADGDLIIEGVAGAGDKFMQGEVHSQALPADLTSKLEGTYEDLSSQLGAVRFEWAYDGERVWILQLHRGRTPSSGNVIYPGNPSIERQFLVANGLEALRDLIEHVDAPREGIVLIGGVGVTSHFGDVLRRARVPSRIAMDKS
jgi:hypothetical protein